MKNVLLKITAVMLMSVPLSSYAMPMLDVQGGQLMGASGVDVGGTLYDVEFVDGTCVALFTGCDENSDFTFNTRTDAALASQALLDQVLIDSLAGNFDTSYDLTAGCGLNSSDVCILITPFEVPTGQINAIFLNNERVDANDFVGAGVRNAASTTAGLANATMARWTIQTHTAIPEPGILSLALLGLLALRLSRRHNVK